MIRNNITGSVRDRVQKKSFLDKNKIDELSLEGKDLIKDKIIY